MDYTQTDISVTEWQEKALKECKRKCIREQRNVACYQDNKKPTVFYIVAEGTASDRMTDAWTLIHEFDPDTAETDNIKQQIEVISDFKSLKEGDQVFVDNETLVRIRKVSKTQITADNGQKFRRSDGGEWGEDDGSQITKKVI